MGAGTILIIGLLLVWIVATGKARKVMEAILS
jgi:hypothetical protein